jgi:hypothetical protein
MALEQLIGPQLERSLRARLYAEAAQAVANSAAVALQIVRSRPPLARVPQKDRGRGCMCAGKRESERDSERERDAHTMETGDVRVRGKIVDHRACVIACARSAYMSGESVPSSTHSLTHSRTHSLYHRS